MILAINTSTPQFSLALVDESGALQAEWTLSPKSKDFHHFMPALDHLLQVSGIALEEIRSLAVAKGPGSFTGLRVGLSAAKGFCEGLGLPIVGLSSLEVLASQCPGVPLPICPLIDSRKGEVFAALYAWSEEQGLVRLEPETCLKIIDLPGFLKEKAFVLGTDFGRQKGPIASAAGDKAVFAPPSLWALRAATLGMLAARRTMEHGFDRLQNVVPSYLRPPDIRPNRYPVSTRS
ncbi:MAG: tRNA (adenosine(37)-N6)-threonylcarbamoyltransferase complex dimerization subunit type 1 TsaB [Deltaproteobacteria bacterium]